MVRLTSLVTLMTAAALAAAPALGEEPARKTELVELDGTSVDIIQLRHDFDAAWVIDNRSLLYRDTSRDHYLVTLKEPCKQLDIRRRSFNFFPSWSWRLLSSNTYEVRHETGLGTGQATGQPCDVARIEKIDETRANTLRDAVHWRVW